MDELTQQIAALLILPMASLVVQDPGAGDVYAVVGALIAAVCTLFNAYELRRSAYQKATLFIGSATMGSIGPGLTVTFCQWKGWNNGMELTWHGWAGLGLVFGLTGWGALHTVLRGMTAYLERRAKSFLGEEKNRENP